MNEQEYIKDRLEAMIRWYSQKSAKNQKWFKRLQILSIILATTIPFLSGFSAGDSNIIRIVIGFTGLVVAATTAIMNLYKLQENWVEYRATCESLKQEKYLFYTKTEPYDCEKPFQLLVQRVESKISKQNTSWVGSVSAAKADA